MSTNSPATFVGGHMDHITMKQALNMSGKTSTTLRRWIAEGSVIAKKNQGGRWEIDRHSLRVHLAQHVQDMSMNSHPSPTNSTEQSPDMLGDMSPTGTLLNSLQESLKREREALTREQKINDELRNRLEEKDRELLKLTYEMQAILRRDDKGLLSRWLRSN